MVAQSPSVEPLAARTSARRDDQSLIALEKGARALVAKQAKDGSWEGEVVWSPMLAAELVLACHLMGRPVDAVRKRRVLRYFERSRSADGLWGLSQWSGPSLFVTTLVYVAARILGEAPEGPLLARPYAFLRREDVRSIPSWGKFWLAMMNLYAWEGVNPVSPAVWSLPRWLPIHPSRYYCHTRLIYLGMATLYGERFTLPRSPLTDALRLELYPNGYEAVDFPRARTSLWKGDLYAPPSAILWASYRVLGWVERFSSAARRQTRLQALRERIRYELRTTSYTSISPVSGILNILALHAVAPDDEDAAKAFARLEDWIQQDDEEGLRVAGARSSTWDTSFAVQALTQAAPYADVEAALERADAFLGTQQMRDLFGHDGASPALPERGPHQGAARDFDRVDSDGGYCFAGVWHGWPVSDCTAEAILARIESPAGHPETRDIDRAVRFILRTQNADGGFGSYEPNRAPFSLERLNPAEMFGDSMTESSYVECAASCVTALAAARHTIPDPHVVDEPILRAVAQLRRAQLPSGAWPGSWGVRLVYGTMFGIRGLVAGGVSRTDPQIRKACAMLLSHQRADGSWGEAHFPAPSDRYRDAAEGQVIQTAWAMLGLLAAGDPDMDALARAARFLANRQLPGGDWPTEDPAGVFFHTALLDYELYKSYFPVWALAEYETRRATRRGTQGAAE